MFVKGSDVETTRAELDSIIEAHVAEAVAAERDRCLRECERAVLVGRPADVVAGIIRRIREGVKTDAE